MLFQRELLTLIITAFATSNVAAASAPERNLRGSSYIAEVVEESPASLIADEHVEDRQLQSDTGLANGKGHYKDKGQPITTTVAPTDAPVTAVCDPPCGSDQICAQSGPDAAAECYDECVAFPSLGICTVPCVFSTFTCGSSASVVNEFCECNNLGSYECRYSECGLFIRD